MYSLNNIVIAIAILLFAAFTIQPVFKPEPLANVVPDSLLSPKFLGDGSDAFLPLPLELGLDAEKIALGERLFHDPLLSGNGFSCASCHSLAQAGMDGRKLSLTTGGGTDIINTPSVFNSGFNHVQGWNGRHDSLAAQLDSVITNPRHMDSSWALIMPRLAAKDVYFDTFSRLYTDGLSKANVTNAITTFQQSLITPNAAFDRYLRGDEQALDDGQKRGLKLFRNYGCSSCHQGINIGGNLFARFGTFHSGFAQDKTLTDYDYGRYSYTGDTLDRFVFRVPSLRNVARTAPYFHDGSAETLADAIDTMAWIQLDIKLADNEIADIEAFLHSLTGEFRGQPL